MFHQLKRKLVAAGVATATAFAALAPLSTANAQQGADVQFTTAVTYQNVSNATANVTFTFYQPNGTPQALPASQLPAGASSSLFLGSVTQLGAGFQGSGIIQSDQQIVATVVQLQQGSNGPNVNRPLSNGYATGAARQLIASVLKNPTGVNQITKIAVQNTGSAAASATLRFFAVGQTTPTFEQPISNLAPGASQVVDVRQISQIPNGFNGSATLESTGGSFAATVLELSTANTTALAAFDATPEGATTIYMPSALCRFGGQQQQSAYAVQNVSASGTANVTVRYDSGANEAKSIPAGGKATFFGCGGDSGNGTLNAANYSGSATITSQGGSIVAIGKVFGGGRSTAALGVPTGAPRLALPYVRWATDANFNAGNNNQNQRTFITVQNVGSAPVTGVRVRYVNPDGSPAGEQTLGAIAPGAKISVNPGTAGLTVFGYPTANSAGGGAIVEGPAGSQLVSIARVESRVPGTNATRALAEDYNSFVIP
jgi:hypothetical protein